MLVFAETAEMAKDGRTYAELLSQLWPTRSRVPAKKINVKQLAATRGGMHPAGAAV